MSFSEAYTTIKPNDYLHGYSYYSPPIQSTLSGFNNTYDNTHQSILSDSLSYVTQPELSSLSNTPTANLSVYDTPILFNVAHTFFNHCDTLSTKSKQHHQQQQQQQQDEEEKQSIPKGERILILMAYILVLLSFPFSLIFSLHVIRYYERAVIFRLGRLLVNGPTGPGLLFALPYFDLVERVDLRTFTFAVLTQDVLTKDSVSVSVEAVVYYRIYNPILSVVNVKNVNYSTHLLAQTTLRDVLGTVDMCDLLSEREHIASLMQESLDLNTDNWGMKVERVEIKDVRLPIHLQKSMAAEAEAQREACAKVILAQGEHDASRLLKVAAQQIGDCPQALQLRYLHTLNRLVNGKDSVILFPLPIQMNLLFETDDDDDDDDVLRLTSDDTTSVSTVASDSSVC